MYNLTPSQKDLLRWIVIEVRAKQMPEEFSFVWGQEGAALHYAGAKGFYKMEGVTQGALDALAVNGLLHISTRPDDPFGIRNCTLMGQAYEAVDSDFGAAEPAVMTTHPISAPPEIQESLSRFHSDYPPPAKIAFVMMQFGKTKAHDSILQAIRAALRPYNIHAVRADEKDYHDDLLANILTYVFGCSFGVAVFERLESDQFNPNISLEVGYMLALRKPVCLLKDQTLHTLTTDLVGKLYKSFDPQNPSLSIPPELVRWCQDRKLI